MSDVLPPALLGAPCPQPTSEASPASRPLLCPPESQSTLPSLFTVAPSLTDDDDAGRGEEDDDAVEIRYFGVQDYAERGQLSAKIATPDCIADDDGRNAPHSKVEKHVKEDFLLERFYQEMTRWIVATGEDGVALEEVRLEAQEVGHARSLTQQAMNDEDDHDNIFGITMVVDTHIAVQYPWRGGSGGGLRHVTHTQVDTVQSGVAILVLKRPGCVYILHAERTDLDCTSPYDTRYVDDPDCIGGC
jgi:hypothetical protein